MLTLFSANIANAPRPGDVTLADAGGEMIIDAFYMLAGCLLIRFVIAPVFRKTIKYVGRGLRSIKGSSTSGPGKWYRVKEGMKPRAARYQTQITGQPIENGYVANGVKFDGFKGGKLLEAKGPGYKNFIESNGKFNNTWWDGRKVLIKQAKSQFRVANGAPIEWHIAEENTFKAMKKLFVDESLPKIKLIHTPAR